MASTAIPCKRFTIKTISNNSLICITITLKFWRSIQKLNWIEIVPGKLLMNLMKTLTAILCHDDLRVRYKTRVGGYWWPLHQLLCFQEISSSAILYVKSAESHSNLVCLQLSCDNTCWMWVWSDTGNHLSIIHNNEKIKKHRQMNSTLSI